MAIEPANTFSTFDAIGNREDLSDIIYNVAPTDTPFLTGIGRTSAAAVLFEWQTDTLDAATGSSGAVIEGADASTDAVTPTVRMSNTAMILSKVPRVTGSQQAITSAGRKDELALQLVKSTKALRRDMETALLENNAEAAGDVSTAREFGSIEAWLHTNESRGTNGAAGADGSSTDGNTAATDGTQRAFTEAMLKEVLRECWDSGGDPDCVMVGSFNKQVMSTFTGNATRFKGAEDKQLVAAIDIYQSDFGDVEIIPNRFQRSRSALVLQKDMWAVSYLRPVSMADLAKTGDSERRQIITEFTLQAKNALSSGIIADLTVS